jgi:Domain of unknown function (DUF4160)
MPEVSRYCGIIISIFAEAGERHHTPHFHAYYGGSGGGSDFSIVVAIGSLKVIEGRMPSKQQKMILGWAAAWQDELLDDWNLVINGRRPRKIPPLRGKR